MDHRQQLVRVEGLHNPAGCSGLASRIFFFCLRLGGEHEDGNECVSGQLTNGGNHFDAIHIGHVEVGDDQVELSTADFAQAIFARAAEQLTHYVNSLGLPVLGFLRDTQNYVQLAAHGTTLWDVAPSRVERDIEQWRELIGWVEG